MKKLCILIFVLSLFFLTLFIVGNSIELTSELYLSEWIDSLAASSLGFTAVCALVIGSLIADILLPIPSSVVMTISGKLLGFTIGGMVSFVGAVLASIICFYVCRKGGVKMYTRLIGEDDTNSIEQWFNKYGVYALIVSRPIPILAEVLSCVAGVTGFAPKTFIIANILGYLPLCFFYSWIGSEAAESLPLSLAVIIPLVPIAVVLIVKQYKQTIMTTSND